MPTGTATKSSRQCRLVAPAATVEEDSGRRHHGGDGIAVRAHAVCGGPPSGHLLGRAARRRRCPWTDRWRPTRCARPVRSGARCRRRATAPRWRRATRDPEPVPHVVEPRAKGRRWAWSRRSRATLSATAVAVVTGTRRVEARACGAARREGLDTLAPRHHFGVLHPGPGVGPRRVPAPRSASALAHVSIALDLVGIVVPHQCLDGQAPPQLWGAQADVVERGRPRCESRRWRLFGFFVMQAHDQVVTRPGHAHVQKAVLLERVEGTLALVGLVEPQRAKPPPASKLRRPVLAPQHRRRSLPGRHIALEPGQDDDREFEALGAVDRHDAHGVVIGVRRAHATAAPVVLGLEVGPSQERPQRATHRSRRRAGPGP